MQIMHSLAGKYFSATYLQDAELHDTWYLRQDNLIGQEPSPKMSTQQHDSSEQTILHQCHVPQTKL